MAKATNSPPPIVFLLSILVFSLLISVNKIDAASKSVNKEKIEFLKSKAKIRVADSRIEDEVEHEFDDDQLSTRIPKLGFNFTLPNITRQGDLGNLVYQDTYLCTVYTAVVLGTVYEIWLSLHASVQTSQRANSRPQP